MGTTSRNFIVGAGLAALTLIACGGPGAPDTSQEPPTGLVTDGGGGSGGGGEPVVKEVELIKWVNCVPDVLINATVYGQSGKENFDYEYIPVKTTIQVGNVVGLLTMTSTQNMTSGIAPVEDGKFFTPQGRDACLRFNVAGTYPFFDYARTGIPADPVNGVIYVLE